MSREKGNCKQWSTFLDTFLTDECSNLFIWKQETNGSLRMDICFRDSCLSLQCSQKNFCSASSLSDLVNRSKHLISVDTLEFTPAKPRSPLRTCGFVFATPKLLSPASMSKEMSIQGSKVVDVNPQLVQVTSDLRIPENTLWAMQQSPWPVMGTNDSVKIWHYLWSFLLKTNHVPTNQMKKSYLYFIQKKIGWFDHLIILENYPFPTCHGEKPGYPPKRCGTNSKKKM